MNVPHVSGTLPARHQYRKETVMGYTNYWWRERDLDAEAFVRAAADCEKVCKASGVPLAGPQGKPDTKPTFSSQEIVFNGVGENAHETFFVPRTLEEDFEQLDATGKLFTFTKTARKPYDVAVCACLIVLKHHFGCKIRVQSDGDMTEEGWAVAPALCQRVLGYGGDFKLDA
jgi:hypothetical protein